MEVKSNAERVLWNYRTNVFKASEYREMLSNMESVRGQDYGGHAVNGVSDPVPEVVNRKLKLEKKLSGMEKEIRAVDNLMDSLDEKELDMHQMLGILNRRYILHKETDTIIRELGITKATYYRRKNALIELAEIYMS